MSDWVEFNIPWNGSVDYKSPNYPYKAVDKKVVEKFGYTRESLSKDFKKKYKKETWEVISDARDKANLVEEEDSVLLDIPSQLKEVKEAIDVMVKKEKIVDFINKLPEVKKWSKECDKINKINKKEIAKKFFRHNEMCRTGVLIEVNNNGVISKHLIGDINEIGGVCDDCREFSDEAIVLRAKVVYDPNLDDKKDKLYNVVKEFINRLDIHCPETICQTDSVIENAYSFIEDCCDVVGYKDDDEP